MIKAFISTFILLGLAMLLIQSGAWNLLASDGFFWFAMILLVVVVGAAFIILGNPLNGFKDDDEKGN